MGQIISQSAPPGNEDCDETQSLLSPIDIEEHEEAYHDGCFPPHRRDDICPANPHPDLPIYTTIHRIRRDVIEAIDDAYSVEQLRDPRINISVVRPLVDKLYGLNDVSIVYCLLVNRVQFLREQATQPHQQSVCVTRASLCEIIASRILRRYNEDNSGTSGLLLLAQVLVGGFDPFQGAPEDVVLENSYMSWTYKTRSGSKRRLPALEIAIISESKTLLSSSASQKVITAIYEGRVVYTPSTFMDILPDHYKNKPISLYNPREGPLLNQYRLIVPRTRNILEVCQFIVLLALFLFVMAERDPSQVQGKEIVFIVYAIGWTLEQIATVLEHGWHVYTQNLWSFLDVTFSIIFGVYLVLRIHGWRIDRVEIGQQALDVLAMGAPVLVPRLAFNLMSENMLFVSLRAMMRDFAILTVLAAWCFAGFLLSMLWLSDGAHGPVTVSKWMLWVWFGLDGTGIQRSVEFHWILGPILMVTFAFLGNTLFLTILVSMLSTTFSLIVSNATAEIQFRRAVLTLEGVKSDAIFAYLPPFNILAVLVLLPVKFVLSPRWFHKINVAAVRILNAPLLLTIGLLERRMLWASQKSQAAEQLPVKPIPRARLWNLSRGFSVHGDIQAVFLAEPPEEIEDEIEADEDVHRRNRNLENEENDFAQAFGYGSGSPTIKEPARLAPPKPTSTKIRRDSVAPFAGATQHFRDILNEHGGEYSDDLGDLSKRLGALERSSERIEKMLAQICSKVEDSNEGDDLETSANTSIRDLDKSGLSDIDD